MSTMVLVALSGVVSPVRTFVRDRVVPRVIREIALWRFKREYLQRRRRRR